MNLTLHTVGRVWERKNARRMQLLKRRAGHKVLSDKETKLLKSLQADARRRISRLRFRRLRHARSISPGMP